ncbi:unnamed protein product [Rotaria magnacalcarata]|uniref:DUS-like FMN-binding domain-containing protein n=1 Tax=Rotaria magnacalcarata TaxID=392030 RepID=A0A819GPV8_9BILA|nr:unnamed protein product [Rotaria magnacalcarata]CAF2080266.1 unnamed protein product [Rotaria magnacalcarata]CAF3827769.1 unnamed protein product [Rotaria magnacalcarata]CAF3885224.1 unnamed protein product [Rotaria magnacalcarata]
MDYSNRILCGPMVRISSLPFRLLALEYGADIVFSEELIDYRLMQCVRVENNSLNTVDFVVPGEDRPMLQIHKTREKSCLVVQLGTADGQRALNAARLVENDAAGIDVNMGCPKKFSIQGGMGSALLNHPDKVKQILETLVNNLSIPVSCKIRCLPSLEATLSLVRTIATTGVHAITIHGRTRDERNNDECRETFIQSIVQQCPPNVVIVANGGSTKISSYSDIQNFRLRCGPAHGVMICQAAMWNPSVFRSNGSLPISDVAKRFLQICLEFDNHLPNIKYVLQRMYGDLDSENQFYEKMLSTETEAQIYTLFDMKNEYEQSPLEERRLWREKLRNQFIAKLDEESENNIIEKSAKYIRSDYTATLTPKSILTAYFIQTRKDKPIYHTEELKPQRIFRTVLEFDGQRYTTSTWEKSKQLAEQGSAIVCLQSLGVDLTRAKYGINYIKTCSSSENKV